MTVQEKVQELKNNFKRNYSYLTTSDVEDIYETALGIYLSLKFPLHNNVVDIPENNIRDINWIRLCMKEILERSGASSAVAYSENGLSIQYDNSMLSSTLMSMLITPMAKIGVIRR